jgi:tRNA(Ile)-lysidine synthase
MQLPNHITASRHDGKIVFALYRKCECRAGFTPPIQLSIPGKTKFTDFQIEADSFEFDAAKFEKFRKTKNSFIEWFDFEKLKLPLEIRQRKLGDKFWPLGLAGEKKVGKFLTASKISSSTRRKLLVICDAEKIIWLCPVRISEQTRVAGESKTVLQLKIADISQT